MTLMIRSLSMPPSVSCVSLLGSQGTRLKFCAEGVSKDSEV